MPAGAGGLGGVGGDGGGPKLEASPLRAALEGAAGDDAALAWLYPYDSTVWPRGLPAPLLQWTHGEHAPAAVKLTLDVAPSFHAGNGRFGGATLAIQRNAYDPALIAGMTTNDNLGCRVCHTVSGDGSTLIVQRQDGMPSSAYDLRDMNKETVYGAAENGKFGWAALTPDGSVALGNAGPPGNNAANVASLAASAPYKVADGSVLRCVSSASS